MLTLPYRFTALPRSGHFSRTRLSVSSPCLEDLRNILNSGHTRATAQVIRCDENLNVKVFSTFAPKLLAMIGKP